jgi:hypothetical protein
MEVGVAAKGIRKGDVVGRFSGDAMCRLVLP